MSAVDNTCASGEYYVNESYMESCLLHQQMTATTLRRGSLPFAVTSSPGQKICAQVKRVVQRDWAIYAKREMLRSDGHDNNFLLFEALLAVPFAVGYKTQIVAPLLAATLLLEAVFCWWPLKSWPSV